MADIKLIIDVDDDGKIQKATDSLEKLEVAAKKTGSNASDMATAFSPSGNLQRNTFSFKDTVDDTTGSLGMMFEQMAGGAAPQDAFIDFVAGLGGSLGPIGAIMIPAVTAGLVALGPKIIEHTGLFKDFGSSVEKAAAGIDSVISSFENYQSLTGGDVDLGREVSAFAQRSLQYDVSVASKDATKVMSGLFGHMETLVKRYEFAGSRGPEEAARLESMKVALKYLSEVDEVDTSSVKDMVDTLKTVNVVLEQQLEGSLNLDKKKIEKLREFGDSITEFLASVEMNQAKLDAALGYGVDESATVARDRSGLVRRRDGKTAKDPLKAYFESHGIRSAPFISAPRYGGDFAANEFWASHDASSDDYVTKGYAANDVKMGVEDGLKAYFESHGIRSAPFISAPRYGGDFAANEFWASHGARSDDHVAKGYEQADKLAEAITDLTDEVVASSETQFELGEMFSDFKDRFYDGLSVDVEAAMARATEQESVWIQGLIQEQTEAVETAIQEGTVDIDELYSIFEEYQHVITETNTALQEEIMKDIIAQQEAREAAKRAREAQEANTEALNANAELLRDFFKSQGVDIRPFSTAPRYGGDFAANEFWAMHNYPEEEEFAIGGVVNRATRFGMTNGRRGVMGEAGPEAILPLRRGADGKLGVAMNGGSGQVVINQSFNFSANGDDSVKRIIASEAPKIAKITERSIINSRQRGGSIRKVFG